MDYVLNSSSADLINTYQMGTIDLSQQICTVRKDKTPVVF